jgi:hypothetical protein
VTIDEKKAVLQKLVQILNGDVATHEGSRIISEDVLLHMDDSHMQGYNLWHAWLTFVREQGRIPDLGVQHNDTVLHEDGTLSLVGHWTGTLNGLHQLSNDCTVRYRIEDGLIREIWTHRTNYILPLGGLMRYSLTWWLVGARYMIWKRLSRHDARRIRV